MNHSQYADHLEVRTVDKEMTLEQLDLRNRKFHHLHDEIIASKVSRFMLRMFGKEWDDQLR